MAPQLAGHAGLSPIAMLRALPSATHTLLVEQARTGFQVPQCDRVKGLHYSGSLDGCLMALCLSTAPPVVSGHGI